MEILYILLILLIITRIFGELAVRLGQPSLTGEIIAGIILGLIVKSSSASFPVLSDLQDNNVFIGITDLGIFFLMLLGGIEMRPRELLNASGKSFFIALSAMILPFFLGFLVAWLFLPESDYKFAQALFVGTGLAITAVPVAIRVLMDLNQLNTPIGRLIVSAAIFDDVLSLILLAILTSFLRTGGIPDATAILQIIGKMAVFFIITIAIGYFLLPRLGNLVKRFIIIDEYEFSFLLIIALGFSVFAEWLGMHFILGVFIAGLFFGRRTLDAERYEDVKKKVSGIATGFLAPIFFASIGLHLDLHAVTTIPIFLILLIAVAFFSKFLGAALPAMLTGFSRRESMTAGVAMSARGAVELIIADIALRAGLFDHPDPQPDVVKHLFSAIVIVAIVTTLIVPILLRYIIKPSDDKE